MQTHSLSFQELADVLSESRILDIIDTGALRQYVVEHDGKDILIFEAGGDATAVYPAECFDIESGGGIHDHARAIKQAANDAHARLNA